MTIDEMRDLYAYDDWANNRAFAAAESLSDAEARATIVSSFPSVLATLAHLVGAEWVWLRRCHGESPTSVPAWAGDSSLAALGAELAAIQGDRSAYLRERTDADLVRLLEFRTLAGQAYAQPLGGILQHVVNHSTYHRGQVATQLRQLGRTPPNTDLITYLRLPK